MEIGSKLRELRIAKNLTQEELADRAELSKGFISQVERDLTSPSIATLMDILQCLGTSLKDFFQDDSEIFPFRRAEGSWHVLPHHESWANKLSWPLSMLIHLPHFTNETYLF